MHLRNPFRQAPQHAPEAELTGLEALHVRLSAYLDGEATEAERRAAEAEVAADEDARAWLDDASLIRETLSALPEHRAPRSFALEAPPASVRRAPGRLEWASRAATGMAALLFAVVLIGPGGGGADTPIMQRSSADDAAGGAAVAPEAFGASEASDEGQPSGPLAEEPEARQSAPAGLDEPTSDVAPASAPPAPQAPPTDGAGGAMGGGTGGGVDPEPQPANTGEETPSTGQTDRTTDAGDEAGEAASAFSAPASPGEDGAGNGAGNGARTTAGEGAEDARPLDADGTADEAAASQSSGAAWALGILTAALAGVTAWQAVTRRRASR